MSSDLTVPIAIQPTIAWHTPILLPNRTDVPPPQINSMEKVAQTTRMVSVSPASYSTGYNVPSNPTPLNDVEQALDMTSQSSTVTQSIPFFVPLAQVLAQPPAPQALNSTMGVSMIPPPQSQLPLGAASPEIVQSLGLPMFLVGHNIQALQTLAATPSLLSTFVDSNGVYDQVRLTNLVQTLSQGTTSGQQPPPSANYLQPGVDQISFGGYDSGINVVGGIYGSASSGGGGGGYRGTQNNGEGNLHLSGYGPLTTQSEIIALFSPYVIVDEVVMKANFCFVNTSDPLGANRAKEALNGALLGGQPVRINPAQRKSRDGPPPSSDLYSATPSAGSSSYYGNQTAGFTPSTTGAAGMSGFGLPPSLPGVPAQTSSNGDISNVRDDRGNPATKNLFVAGYGQGTSEALLRQVFSPHCEIVGVIMKGTFSFINTAEKGQAVRAREMLSGTMLNGGVLRINFAKESGRLGTSFDLTYGNKAQQPRSHYGPRGI
jgi:RNA recognition motif-containing protein